MIDVLAALGHADATDDKPRAIKLVLMAEVRRTKTKSSIASLSLAQDFLGKYILVDTNLNFSDWFRSTRGQLGCPLRAYGPACNAEQLRCKAERRLRHRNAETASTFGIRPLGQSTRNAGGHCDAVEHLCNADATT